jgi:hypothetical protein
MADRSQSINNLNEKRCEYYTRTVFFPNTMSFEDSEASSSSKSSSKRTPVPLVDFAGGFNE